MWDINVITFYRFCRHDDGYEFEDLIDFMQEENIFNENILETEDCEQVFKDGRSNSYFQYRQVIETHTNYGVHFHLLQCSLFYQLTSRSVVYSLSYKNLKLPN